MHAAIVCVGDRTGVSAVVVRGVREGYNTLDGVGIVVRNGTPVTVGYRVGLGSVLVGETIVLGTGLFVGSNDGVANGNVETVGSGLGSGIGEAMGTQHSTDFGV